MLVVPSAAAASIRFQHAAALRELGGERRPARLGTVAQFRSTQCRDASARHSRAPGVEPQLGSTRLIGRRFSRPEAPWRPRSEVNGRPETRADMLALPRRGRNRASAREPNCAARLETPGAGPIPVEVVGPPDSGAIRSMSERISIRTLTDGGRQPAGVCPRVATFLDGAEHARPRAIRLQARARDGARGLRCDPPRAASRVRCGRAYNVDHADPVPVPPPPGSRRGGDRVAAHRPKAIAGVPT